MLSKREYFKIKVAIVLGYNGLGFHGMQKNEGVKTIEETLENALYESTLIADTNYKNLQKIAWMRAARTDKGVHAVANFVSCKLSITSKFVEGLEEQAGEEQKEGATIPDKATDKSKVEWKKVINVINSNLPNDIRIHFIKRTTKPFDCKASARSRIYEYIAPLALFVKDGTNLTPEEEEKTILRIKSFCEKYKGTHNFHNYTKKMKASDPKANRFIMAMDCSLIDLKEKGKWVKFILQGQSFIYHQIRKMIGMIIQIIQQGLPDQFLSNSFYQNAVSIWLAPPHGLLLDKVTYESYNRKKDIPELLEFSEEEIQKLQEFKESTIYPSILEAEEKEKAFTDWLSKMKEYPSGGKWELEESSGAEDDEGDNGKGKGKGKGKEKDQESDNE